MLKNWIAAGVFAGVLGLTASVQSAQAMPLGNAGISDGNGDARIILVYGGCGPYGHRGPYGGCQPGGQWGFPGGGDRGVPPIFGPYGGRWCPPGYHLGPYRGRCWPN